jgi:hypothetical protein
MFINQFLVISLKLVNKNLYFRYKDIIKIIAVKIKEIIIFLIICTM